jgi:hypothetical protein
MKRLALVLLVFCLAFSSTAQANQIDAQGGGLPLSVQPQALQDEIRQLLDITFLALPSLVANSAGLLNEITRVLSLLLYGGSSTCPLVTVNPPLTDLFSIPSNLTATLNYGAGCYADDGSYMSGSITIALSRITYNFVAISANYSLTLVNLTKNGQLVGNGTMNGSLQMTLSAQSAWLISDLTMTATMTNFQASAYMTLSGTVSITASGFSGTSISNVAVTLSNFTIAYNYYFLSGQYVIYSGTVTSSKPTAAETYYVNFNLATNGGNVIMNTVTNSPLANYYDFSTIGSATVLAYSLTAANVILNTAQCSYPIGGTLNVTKGGQHATVIFQPTCDGTYIVY